MSDTRWNLARDICDLRAIDCVAGTSTECLKHSGNYRETSMTCELLDVIFVHSLGAAGTVVEYR